MRRFNVIRQSAKTVDAVVNNAHSYVAFLGEMDHDGQPWLAKVDLEAVETRTLTEIKFKLYRGAVVTVISEEDCTSGGKLKLCDLKTIVRGKPNSFDPHSQICGRLLRGDAM